MWFKEQVCSLPSQLPGVLLSPHVPAGMTVLLPSMPMAAMCLCRQLLSIPFLSTTMAQPGHASAQAAVPGRQSFAVVQKGAK